MTEQCEHFAEIRDDVAPRTGGCEECIAIGATWTQLRVCLICGHVGCCEDSQHAHALQHFNTTGHPMIASLERGDTWGWCYVHRRYFDPMPGRLPKRRTAFGRLLSRLTGR
ncbi:MAG TPA: UBP-type zinc finger domain-containing protein [Casimicrobiaceae bacterium]